MFLLQRTGTYLVSVYETERLNHRNRGGGGCSSRNASSCHRHRSRSSSSSFFLKRGFLFSSSSPCNSTQANKPSAWVIAVKLRGSPMLKTAQITSLNKAHRRPTALLTFFFRSGTPAARGRSRRRRRRREWGVVPHTIRVFPAEIWLFALQSVKTSIPCFQLATSQRETADMVLP
jgi:hypothetical protein